MARCPAHDDHTPSLSISQGERGVLVRCFGGCSQEVVISKLKSRGLWQPAKPSNWAEWRKGIRYPSCWGKAVREYIYTDESGAELYRIIRFEPKSFRPGFFDHGRWVWKKHPRQVLYHLREVIEAEIVFVVEGEKDADALREHGFCATTNAGGSNAPWLSSYTDALAIEVNNADKTMILIPDNDPPGWQRAKRIALALCGRGLPIIVFDDVHRQGCKDIADWFAAGHSERELVSLLDGACAA